MRRIQALSIIVLTLTISSITAAPIVLMAENQGEHLGWEIGEQRAEAMLNLLNQTLKRVNTTLETLNETLEGIPPRAFELYGEALELYNNATVEFEVGNYTKVVRLCLQALPKLKLSLEIAMKAAVEPLAKEFKEIAAFKRLYIALERLKGFIKRVEHARDMLLQAFPDLESNITTLVDPLIEEAWNLAEEAEEAIAGGNYTEASAFIKEANAKAAEALAAINRLTNHKLVMALRIKRFILVSYARFSAHVRRRAPGLGLGLALGRLLEEAEESLEEAGELAGKGYLRLAKLKLVQSRARILRILRLLEEAEEESRRRRRGRRP